MPLTTFIQQEIDQRGGHISFAAFMALALYHPQFGYYCQPSLELGKRGDFTTAPEISPLFAQCFAKQVAQIFQQLAQPAILELGAGTGRFAKDLLQALHGLGVLPTHYYIYEISATLRQKQQDLLKKTCPQWFDRIVWLEALPPSFTGVIIANEVLDALPVHCFTQTAAGILERCVAWENNQFVWQLCAPTTPLLFETGQRICQEYALPIGYKSEINLQLAPLLQSLLRLLTQGVILLADYGYGQREYYHPQRMEGTLTCFYQHHHHGNPLTLVGQQDITAHVDFTRVIECAAAEEGELMGYTSQASFLLACGLLDLAALEEAKLSPAAAFNLHQAIKLLTLPTEMGERVKVMAIGKNMHNPLLGFSLQDRRREL
jgi:SAM-dependent MidA family methyltransferase